MLWNWLFANFDPLSTALTPYAISAGPAWWIADHFACWDFVYAAYAPLIYALDEFPPLFDTFIDYLRLFSNLPS